MSTSTDQVTTWGGGGCGRAETDPKGSLEGGVEAVHVCREQITSSPRGPLTGLWTGEETGGRRMLPSLPVASGAFTRVVVH